MSYKKKGKTADISISGDLINEGSSDFVANMDELIKDGAKRFNIDLSGVKFIDSYSLSMLIIYCDKPDLEFLFRNVSIPVKNIFDITRLDKRVIFE
ncbi:MAG: STAS domain-containing protein [Candidatus Delongbacteria bacterium]